MRHVKVAMTAQVKGYHLLLARFFALQRFLNGHANSVGRFWRRDDPFRSRKLSGLESLQLGHARAST